jgi:ATP-binding cassette subfamily B protein
MRFREPDEGVIMVGGIDIKKIRIKSLRNQFAYASQNIEVFKWTIAENIRYARRDATLDDIQKACKRAEIHDKIMSLPDGYDSVVGEDGSNFSGGEKQRLALARALIREGNVLILDEGTSAIDPGIERLIQKNLYGNIETAIVVSHRLPAIKSSPVIHVMSRIKKGISESGTHEELMKTQGDYYQLYEAQAP